MSTSIADAAGRAPTGPGVYFLLDEDRELIYVGKATNLRRRLQQHARATDAGDTPRDSLRGTLVADVAWEELADEDAATEREADLVVAFAPLLNASYATDGRWVYIAMAVDGSTATATFRLSRTAAPAPARSYGCFPHIGVGVSSPRAIACSEGYVALLRLVWGACQPDVSARHPRPITGPSPPTEARLALDASFAPDLHRFLAGTSPRVLSGLLARSEDTRPSFMLPGLRRDAEQAAAFFHHGPRALRELRLRHGLRAAPMTPEQIRELLGSELRSLLGEVVLPSLDDHDAYRVGSRRARQIATRQALRRRGRPTSPGPPAPLG